MAQKWDFKKQEYEDYELPEYGTNHKLCKL